MWKDAETNEVKTSRAQSMSWTGSQHRGDPDQVVQRLGAASVRSGCSAVARSGGYPDRRA
jgi:hypothetical protein